MPVVDILSAALSGPAGKVVDGPVRNIVNEVLRDHGYASPAEVQALRDDLASLRDQVAGLAAAVDTLQQEAEALREEAASLRTSAAAPAAEAAAEEAASLRTSAAAPAAEAAAEEAAAGEPAAEEPAAVSAQAERLGMSLDQYDLWRAGKLEGYIGPDGYVEIDGQAYRVDVEHEGKPYTLTKHKSPRVMVDGSMISKTKLD